ncbi:MAG: VOC family protein [Gemmatimonadota bacterium]|nr:VOC family protein [Gemmatimonadota bacterium]MDH4351164.1 VOC family protein [Gemmatimonadota bacterium]MDH5197522.1 VOC family protein [Gemmatimonadota bacterium]
MAYLLRRPPRRYGAWLTALALPLLLAVCAKPIALPPLPAAASGAHLAGKFIWRDLLTDDVDAAKRFYGGLFGWEFSDVADGAYAVITHRGRPIGGIVIAETKVKVKVSQWVSWLSVPDVDAAARAVRDAGGTVLRGPMDLEGRGRLVVVTDPQGALLVLARTTDGDPADAEAGIGDWLWTELWTHDRDASLSFYGGLVGYGVDERDIGDGNAYTVLSAGGTPQAGVVRNPFEQVATHWLPYVRVADPVAVAQRVTELGGRVLVEPGDERRKGTAAIVADPTGAAFTIQRWPLN